MHSDACKSPVTIFGHSLHVLLPLACSCMLHVFLASSESNFGIEALSRMFYLG